VLRFTYLAALPASSKCPELWLGPRRRAGPSAGLPAREGGRALRAGFAARGGSGRQTNGCLSPALPGPGHEAAQTHAQLGAAQLCRARPPSPPQRWAIPVLRGIKAAFGGCAVPRIGVLLPSVQKGAPHAEPRCLLTPCPRRAGRWLGRAGTAWLTHTKPCGVAGSASRAADRHG